MYNNEEDVGRDAEVGWKAQFANLALVVTFILWFQVYVYQETTDITEMLRNFYVTWALFYMNALWRLREQAVDGELLGSNQDRLLKQLFHCVVATNLWVAADTNPLLFSTDRLQAAFDSGMDLWQRGVG